MAGATRSSKARQQPQQRVGPPSSQSQASNNTTISDEDINAILNEGAGSATPRKIEAESPRTERSQLSQSSEPLALRQGSQQHASSTATPCEATDLLGIHLKEVISVISRLEGLGLQQLSIQLPKCAVLGEQSSGKSSVIEAISGVRTPRAAGTCTRCPLFINLECSSNPHASWTARIALRFNYEFKSVTRGTKFPGWVPNPNVQEIEFATCNSPIDLEDVIHRAQLALVHPWEDPAVFSQGQISDFDQEQSHAVKFSPNIVCIYVSHPDLPNLSFYDLPGIIGQSPDPNDVVIVKKLVRDYVEDPDALILVACSLTADIITSTASGCAREWKAEDRCIGVLTKPDLLPAGSPHQSLSKVLSNKEHRFGHGYFVVKNPDQVMLNNRTTHQEAREQEQRFFATAEPWSTHLHTYHRRFGTANLQQFLSEKLAGKMVEALPAIHEQVKVRLDEVDAKLKLIPAPPTSHSAARIIADLLSVFSENVRKEIEGVYPHNTWRNLWTGMQKRFMDGLNAMRPTMITRGQRDYGIYDSTLAGTSPDDPLCLSDGDDDEDMETVNSPETSQKKRKHEGTQAPSVKKSRSVPPIPTPVKMKPVHGVDYQLKRTVFQLDELSKHLSENSITKLNDQIQPKVIEDMIKKTIAHWKVPMDKLFNELELGLKEFLRSIFEREFKARKDTKLYTDAWEMVEDILKTSTVEQRYTMAEDAYNDELEGPYIFHKSNFDSEKEATRETYRKGRFNARLKLYKGEMGELVGAEKVNEDKLLRDERLRAVLSNEPYEIEVDVIARVTSYYVLAAQRFHDSICMRIESKFFARLRTKLRDDMDERLGIHDEDGFRKAMELLAEPSQHAMRRKELMAKKNALLEGQHHLDALQAKHGNNITASQLSNGFTAQPSNSSASFGPTSTPLTDEMMDITQSGRIRC